MAGMGVNEYIEKSKGRSCRQKDNKWMCLFEYRSCFVKMRAHICFDQPYMAASIRSESKWDDKVKKIIVSLISRRERGRQQTRGGEWPPHPAKSLPEFSAMAALAVLLVPSVAFWSSARWQSRGVMCQGDAWAPASWKQASLCWHCPEAAKRACA
jgi:hypothetical protein